MISRQDLAKLYHSGQSFEQLAATLGYSVQAIKDRLGSARHTHYVYHQENRVYARRGVEEPVLVKECKTPVEAFEYVESIVNPLARPPYFFKEKNAKGEELGYHSEEYQASISGNCESFVDEAYAKAEKSPADEELKD